MRDLTYLKCGKATKRPLPIVGCDKSVIIIIVQYLSKGHTLKRHLPFIHMLLDPTARVEVIQHLEHSGQAHSLLRYLFIKEVVQQEIRGKACRHRSPIQDGLGHDTAHMQIELAVVVGRLEVTEEVIIVDDGGEEHEAILCLGEYLDITSGHWWLMA